MCNAKENIILIIDDYFFILLTAHFALYYPQIASNSF